MGLSFLSEPREFKDGMFRVLFNDEEKALELYSAISGKTFCTGAKIALMSLDEVLLSKVRNDLAFTVNGKLIVMIEHQSTLNPNMPLRSLQYIFLFFQLFYSPGNALYKEKLIKLPKPEFYVLYNGTKPYPASGLLKLSDSFEGREDGEAPGLELIVNVVNVNYDANMDVLEKSAELKGYALFVDRVRRYIANGEKTKPAIKLAVDECLREGVLADFFKRYKDEVDSMFSLVYDENIAKAVAREEGWEDGLEQGREQGTIQLIERMLLKGRHAEDIAEDTDIPLERVIFIKNGLNKKR
jgi:hypothetical protein